MIDRTTRLRWRRRIRRSKRQVEDIGVQAEEKLEKHFFKRLVKLPGVLRFTVGWLALVLILMGGLVVQTRALDNYFLEDKPAPGGIYTEGILGAFTNANPLYATGSVDNSVSRLVFSGLLKYDVNNKLVPDLAQDWKADENGLVYTFKLPKDLTWHDGMPLTSEDVAFTIETIQNPDAQSPLITGWKGVQVKTPDAQTVVMTLPSPLSSFAYSLTTGIIPKHILEGVPVDQLRSISFNTTNPVGAGPFKWEAIQVQGDTPESRQEQIALLPFDEYVGGAPKLNKFIIRAYHDEDNMAKAFKEQSLSGAAGLTSTPQDLKGDNIYEHNIPMLGEVLVFFKTSQAILKDQKVRQALTMATDRVDIIDGLDYPVAVADAPLLKSDHSYNAKHKQMAFDLNAAKNLLAGDGWKPGADGVLVKNGQPLSFAITTQDSADYRYVSDKLKEQWKALGANVTVNVQRDSQLQQALSNHSYDALLYAIEMGPDPDVFAYWDSTQADVRAANRTNFSEYKSPIADAALESGRTRLSPELRAVKYEPFLKAWRNDAPAIALYQPRFLYLTRVQIFGFNPTSLATGINRYANVNNWMILEDKQPIK